MPALSLRGLPQVVDGLKAMAAQNHRSMQEQARLLIEREVWLHQPEAMEQAGRWRERNLDSTSKLGLAEFRSPAFQGCYGRRGQTALSSENDLILTLNAA